MNRMVLAAAVIAGLGAGAAQAEAVKLGKKVPYANPAEIKEAVRKECGLEEKLAARLQKEIDGAQLVDSLKGASGRVLDLKITGVWSQGGPFGGASVAVEGQLREGGKVLGSVRDRRNTTRGGYGACSKLEVSIEAIAEDIAKWIKNPTMDAKLGDAK